MAPFVCGVRVNCAGLYSRSLLESCHASSFPFACVDPAVRLVAPAFAATPQAGETAPAFRLQDQNGHWRTPADFHGHWLVMYFYPKDFTPGCTTEVCTFRDDIAKLRKAGADVVGVSLDDVKSHAEFAEKYHVPFPLLADADARSPPAMAC